jgi:hypothetical protein
MGAIEAGRLRAIGALLRSVSSFSMGNPHTGAMAYDNGTQRIPFAAIAVEAAGQKTRDLVMFQGMHFRLWYYRQVGEQETGLSSCVSGTCVLSLRTVAAL